MTVRSFCRVFRWAGLAAVVPVLWACNARSLERPELKPDSTFGKTFQQTINRNVDMLFLVDDSSSMRLSQDNLRRNFPAFMTALAGSARVFPTSTSRSSRRTWAPATARSTSCDTTGGKQGIFQYTPARHLHGDRGLKPGATYISRHRRPGELHRQSRETVHLHRGPLGGRLRLRAPVRRHPARARRRRARGARGEPGLPPPRRLPGHHHDHQRGRLLGDARRSAVRHGLEHQHRVAARARPRTSAATSSATCATTARETPSTRAATRRATTWPPRSRTPTAARTTRKATCSVPSTRRIGSRRSRPTRARSSSRRSRVRRHRTR